MVILLLSMYRVNRTASSWEHGCRMLVSAIMQSSGLKILQQEVALRLH